jgi:hypothetical protein
MAASVDPVSRPASICMIVAPVVVAREDRALDRRRAAIAAATTHGR